MELSDFSFFDYDKRPRKKKPDYTGIIVTLLVLLAIALIVDFGLKWTVARAEAPKLSLENIMLSDKEAYEQGENYTLTMCEKFIESRKF